MAIEEAQEQQQEPVGRSVTEGAREWSDPTAGGVQKILSSVRSHLDMDVAFIAEFAGHQRYFRNVDAKGVAPVQPGDTMSMSDGYCKHVVDGLLPELIVDTANVPMALAIAATQTVPIGSHLSVPIRLKNGDVFGTFCCFNYEPDPSLNPRDLHFMRAFADVAAFQIDHELEIAASRTAKGSRVVEALDRGQPTMVYQPVISLADMRVVGVECLARFALDPVRSPDRWFTEAAEMGHGPALELQAIRNALDGLRRIDLPSTVRIWLNLSATTVMHADVGAHLQGFAPDRIVLELTEHDHVDDYAALEAALRPLRDRGVRVAIDDAGAGYSSMSHILNIAPDHIKLDLSLTRNIDADRKRRALAAALIEFGKQTDCTIVAEGVESAAELRELRRLGAHMVQGYFFGKPLPEDTLTGAIETLATRASFIPGDAADRTG